MSRSAVSEPLPAFALPNWLAPAALLIGTMLVGGAAGGLIRPLFVLGCGAIGWYAWRKGPAAHFYSVVLLFCFAPLARRIVDVSLGFDESSLMLVGPLLAILVPGVELLRLLEKNATFDPRLAPLIVSFLCLFYAFVLTILNGNWTDAASGILKGVAPLVYAAALVLTARSEEILDAAISAFMVALPIMGVYAMYQYVDPPDWDRFWMQYASILSAGLPIPYGVRPFSTLNGPASYATFTAAGLLLIFFLRRSWLSAVLMVPAFMGLMLSQYRTAWIVLAVGVLFCLMFRATRWRAGLLIIGGIAAGLAAMSVPQFAEVIGNRLATLGQGSQDGSAQERLQQFITLWSLPDSSIIGSGFTTIDVGTAGTMPVDGMIIAAWLTMGIPVGLVSLFFYLWPIASAIAAALRVQTREAVVIGAFALGALVQIPLASLAGAELGFLFWALIVQTPTARQGLVRATAG